MVDCGFRLWRLFLLCLTGLLRRDELMRRSRLQEVISLASGTDDVERGISTTVMGIYIIRSYDNGEPQDVGIVIEGIKVLTNVGSVIMGFVVLFGLIYALDLRFPENLKYTFEFIQKIIMNLDGHKLNPKIQQLKIVFLK